MQILNPSYYEQLKIIHEMEIDKIFNFYDDRIKKGLDPVVARECMMKAVEPINDQFANQMMNLASPIYLICD